MRIFAFHCFWERDCGHQSHVLAAEVLVDPQDHLLPNVAGKVQVDVRHRARPGSTRTPGGLWCHGRAYSGRRWQPWIGCWGKRARENFVDKMSPDGRRATAARDAESSQLADFRHHFGAGGATRPHASAETQVDFKSASLRLIAVPWDHNGGMSLVGNLASRPFDRINDKMYSCGVMARGLYSSGRLIWGSRPNTSRGGGIESDYVDVRNLGSQASIAP
jgi:hypothetical protein